MTHFSSLNRLNNFHPNLKFTFEKSKSSVNFLDASVSIVDNKLETDLFRKPTDCHQFLHFNSADLFHNKKSTCLQLGIVYQNRPCSYPLTFQIHLENLNTWFCNRRYQQKVLDAKIKIEVLHLLDLLQFVLVTV